MHPVLTGQQQPQGELDENAWIGILERWSEGRKGCDLHKERRAFTSRCPWRQRGAPAPALIMPQAHNTATAARLWDVSEQLAEPSFN